MEKTKVYLRAVSSFIAAVLISGALASCGTVSSVDHSQPDEIDNVISENGVGAFADADEKKVFSYGTTVDEALASLENSILYNSKGAEKLGGVLCSGDVLVKDKGALSEKAYTVIVVGDATGDGIVNAKDIIAAKLFLNNSIFKVYTEAVDKDSDGVVTENEITDIVQAIVSTATPPSAPTGTHTVTFVDWDGRVIRIHADIENGGSAVAPAAPVRDGYVFDGWDVLFTGVTGDLTVTAKYTQITEPTIYVSNTTAKAGETVLVTVDIANNPGVAGAKLKLTYDVGLTLTNVSIGEAFAELDYTAPAAMRSGCFFNWDSLMQQSKANGTVLALTFAVSDTAVPGNIFDIDITYNSGDVYDTDLNDVTLNTVGGSITVN